MLFESEKQASLFLRYNEGDVNPDGTSQMRVYYCPACCGYHISSHIYSGDGKATDRLIAGYRMGNNGGSLQESINLFEKMISLHFSSKKEVKDWLKTQTQISEMTKAWAISRYYQEGYRMGIILRDSNKFVTPFSEVL